MGSSVACWAAAFSLCRWVEPLENEGRDRQEVWTGEREAAAEQEVWTGEREGAAEQEVWTGEREAAAEQVRRGEGKRPAEWRHRLEASCPIQEFFCVAAALPTPCTS
eukprot:205024-Chlamydomonas_euryale.AAC.1